jgi:hypothetical protein
MQASEKLRNRPIAAMIAWGMFYGTSSTRCSAGPSTARRSSKPGSATGSASSISACSPRRSLSPSTSHPARVGPGRAAYSSLLVPIIAMALSTAFEDYHWSRLAVAGGLLAMAGLLIALCTSPERG